MSQELATRTIPAAVEEVLVNGDLKSLKAHERVEYYRVTCESLGLNPLTQPFAYLTLNNKLTLYALKTCTDQLRVLHGVSVDDVQQARTAEHQIVTVKVRDKHGRTDSATGIVTLTGLKGDALANALMKAETKAKRRATLSICGLGWLDETELETIPPQKVVNPETGRLVDPRSSAQAKKRGDWEKFEHELSECQSAIGVQRLREDYQQNVYPTWPRAWPDQAEAAFDQAMAEHTAAQPEETFADAVAEWDSDGVVWPETRAEYVQQCHDLIVRFDTKVALLTWWNSVEQKAARRRYSLNGAELRELMDRVNDRVAELAAEAKEA